MEAAEFHDCEFTGMALAGAVLDSCRFLSCRFLRCDLSLVKIPDTRFGGCTFEDGRMPGVNWTQGMWLAQDLHGPNVMVRCDVSMGDFSDLDLCDAEFRDCRARDVSFREARLARATFDGTDCGGADFRGADLTAARFVGALDLAIDPKVTTVTGITLDTGGAQAILAGLGVVIETPPG